MKCLISALWARDGEHSLGSSMPATFLNPVLYPDIATDVTLSLIPLVALLFASYAEYLL